MWTIGSRHDKNGAEGAKDFRKKLIELVAEIDKDPSAFIGGICIAGIEKKEGDDKVGTELHGGIAGTATAIGALDSALEKQLAEPRKQLLKQRLEAQIMAEKLAEAKSSGIGKLLGAMISNGEECDCAGCTENRRQEEQAATKH